MNKIEIVQQLVKQLNQYRDEYYNQNKPSVSDQVYDKLFDELSKLEKETGLILSNSPTQTVGYEVKSKLNKVQHSIPLRSLDKTKSVDNVQRFIGNKDGLLMLKDDGLTVELDYENGKLIQGSTRGNGEIGEDVTHNVKVFKNIPLTIPFKGRLKIAGEAIIHKNDFDKINNKLLEEDKYATPRNLVAGSVRQLNSEICSQREVYFYAFGIVECSDELSDSKYEQFKWLSEQGFWLIYHMKFNGSNVSVYQLEQYINNMKQLSEEDYIPIDGMVISFDSFKYSKALGFTNHHNLDALAYKFSDEAQTTTLKEIEWSVGRTGVITPVAIFNTVLLDNTEVTRASVHNLSIMEELELGVGDSISIIKANQIIPQIEENFTRSNNIVIPEECPICHGIAIIDQLNESKILYCTNPDCSAKMIKKFSHFVSRDAMNIDGLSEATLEKFMDEGFIETFSDIYKLEQYKSKIITMDGFGVRSYNKLMQAIENSKEVDMANFIYALGILQVGKGGSKRLTKYFKNDIYSFLAATNNVSNFLNIEDFGEVTAQSIYDYFKDEDNVNEVVELLKFVNIKQPEVKNNNSEIDLIGKTFVITGDFINFKPRKKLEELIESLGGKVSSSVSKSTFALITNDTTSGTKKNQNAHRYGVQIINEEEFMKTIK